MKMEMYQLESSVRTVDDEGVTIGIRDSPGSRMSMNEKGRRIEP